MATFCVPYRGEPPLQGNLDAPASAMARGLAVVRSGDTVAKASAGVVPDGFLNTEVTADGPSYEELVHIPNAILHEVKVSDGKVQMVGLQPGVYYVLKGNVKSGTTFAVGEYVVIAANGEFTDEAGGTTGDIRIGTVDEISVSYAGETGCVVFQAKADLGTVA